MLALAALVSCDAEGGSEGGGAPAGIDCGARTGVVRRVIDGDTLKITLDCQSDSDCTGACAGGVCEKDEDVRLVAINAGEIPHGSPDDPDECLGAEAHERLAELVEGKTVVLVYDGVSGCRDRFNRRLAYVRVDGELVQATLAEEGLVCALWFAGEPRDYLYYEAIDGAEQAAQAAAAGIWGQPRAQACGGKPFPSLCP